MAVRKAYDWEAIESLYRAGKLSIREIARQHGLTEAAIRKRALHEMFAGKRVKGEWFALNRDDLSTISNRGLLI